VEGIRAAGESDQLLDRGRTLTRPNSQLRGREVRCGKRGLSEDRLRCHLLRVASPPLLGASPLRTGLDDGDCITLAPAVERAILQGVGRT
jgi:hypothetical protein